MWTVCILGLLRLSGSCSGAGAEMATSILALGNS